MIVTKHKRKTTLTRKNVKVILTCIMSLTLLLIASNIISLMNIQKLNDKVEQLTNANEELIDSIDAKNQDIQELTVSIEDREKAIQLLSQTVNEMDTQLQELSATNESYVDELNMLRERSELYDKYEYAVINESGNRTQLTYAHIKLGEELMLEKGLDPDLMFGTIMVESRGNPTLVNPSSGATGYGQFLDSTAKWVWTKLMNNESYNSELRKDGEINIKMMVEYYDYLYSEEGDTFGVVKYYSGNSTNAGAARYLAEINSFTQKVGAVVE